MVIDKVTPSVGEKLLVKKLGHTSFETTNLKVPKVVHSTLSHLGCSNTLGTSNNFGYQCPLPP